MKKASLIRSVCIVLLCSFLSVFMGCIGGGTKSHLPQEGPLQKQIREEGPEEVIVSDTLGDGNGSKPSQRNHLNAVQESRYDNDTASSLIDEEAVVHFELADAEVEKYTRALRESPKEPALMLLLDNAKQNASFVHMRRAETLMNDKMLREALIELQISVAFYPGNARAVELLDELKRIKESSFYTEKGERLVKIGNFHEAREAFLNALERNPDNQRAGEALEQYRKSADEIPEFSLVLRSHAPVSFKFKKTPVMNVFEIISKLTGVNFIFDKDVKESKVTLFMTDVKFDQFLNVLLKTNDLAAKMVNSKTMLVYPDTPMKAKIYEELKVRTFYLSHLKAKRAVAILAKIIKTKDVIANEGLNAVTVRGKRDELETAARIIKANDRVPSEVLLNVEILEVNRTKEKNLGLSVSDSITLGISRTSEGIESSEGAGGFASMASLEDIGNITSKELYLSLPTATLMLLKKDGDTKILAKPQIRVTNYGKASILIGERIPLRSNRKVQTDGSTTYDFQYQDVGIKLLTEPEITSHGRVNLKIDLEISSLGNNVGTVDDPQFAIRTKSAATALTLLDGDTVILGGLIQDEDRETVKKVPLLGDIPAIGKLFSSVNNENVETDIIMTITPVIIRSRDIPHKDLASFWSGNAKTISLKAPFEGQNEMDLNYHGNPAEEYIMAMDEVFLPSEDYLTIQVDAFRQVDEAHKRSEQLQKLGYKTWVIGTDIAGKGLFHRVFVGQFNSYGSAYDAYREMLEKDFFARDIRIVDRSYVFGL